MDSPQYEYVPATTLAPSAFSRCRLRWTCGLYIVCTLYRHSCHKVYRKVNDLKIVGKYYSRYFIHNSDKCVVYVPS